MPYHAFLSYAEEDSAFCDEVYRILSAVFDLQAYRYTERPAAGDFMQQICAVLTQKPAPALVVIASDHAVASDYVLDELEEYWAATADDAERLVVFLEIHPDAVRALGRRLALRSAMFAEENLRRFRIIEREETGALVDKLWLALSGRVRDRTLEENRALADDWVAQSLPAGRTTFWDDWRGTVAPLLDRDNVDSLVLTAEGGSGKSVISALYVRYLLESETVMPVVLTDLGALAPDELEPLVCSRVGVPTMRVLPAHLHRLRKRGTQTVFVVDGLDQIGRDPAVHRAFLSALRAMMDATAVLVTCRPEFWSDGFSALGCRHRDVGPLPPERVRQVLARTVRHVDFPRTDILVVPFFLDAVIQSGDLITTAPETETEILDLLWRKYSRGATTAVPDVASTSEVLHHLASLQLDECTYAVPRRLLDARLDGAGVDGGTAIADLTSRGVLIPSWHGADALARLRHDLLDCFGMVRCLLREADGARRRRELYAQSASDIGWPAIAALVQWAHDTGDAAILEEAFGAILGMLDLKRLGESEMARAWAATYVLRGKFDVLRPLAIRCLGGEVAASVSSAGDLPASRLGPECRVTREAASSLASAFEMVYDWTAADPDAAVPVLAMNLTSGRWPGFRRRFLEALTVYRSQEAVDAFLRFAEAEVRTARMSIGAADLAILPDIVSAVGELRLMTRASALLEDVMAVADEVIATSAPVPATRERRLASRRILRALNDVRPHRASAHPAPAAAELTEEEIVDQLKPKEFAQDGTVIYTDWTVVQRAAAHVRRTARTGRVRAEIVSALVGALGHEHTRARTAAAECLSDVDAPESREALIAMLMEGSVPAELRRACLTGLQQQIPRHDGTLAAARRWQLLSASARAVRNEVYSSADDLRLLGSGMDADQNLVGPHAFELFRIPEGVGLRTTFTDDAPIDGPARAVVTAQDVRAVGADLETKYRIAIIDGTSAPVTVALAETTWREAAAWHVALRRLEIDAPEKLDDLLGAWFAHHPLPGIASVHVIVITSDRQVVLAQRGAATIYAPQRWSASFEEQISDSDFLTGADDVFAAAARRGFAEELGDATMIASVEHVGALMEMPLLNPSIVSVVRLSLPLSEVIGGWQHSPEPRELAAIDAVPLADLDGGSLRLFNLHPTAEMRLAMLRRDGRW